MTLNMKVVAPIGILVFGLAGAAVLVAAKSSVETEPPRTPPPLIRALDVRAESLKLKVFLLDFWGVRSKMERSEARSTTVPTPPRLLVSSLGPKH